MKMKTIIFLCDGEDDYTIAGSETIQNNELPAIIKSKLLTGVPYVIDGWTCYNSRKLEVGDRAFLKKTGTNGGFIGAGYVVAAPPEKQLRLLETEYEELSEAYSDTDGQSFWVYIQIDSITDFDFPLEIPLLSNKPEFKNVNFRSGFQRSGIKFNSDAVPFLEKFFDEHTMKLHRIKKGCRLADVFCQQGDAYKERKEYQSAIDAYKKALEIQSNYGKAINKLKICESILNKVVSTNKSSDPIIKQPTILNNTKNHEISELLEASKSLDNEDYFNLLSREDSIRRIFVSIARRQGQTKFRQILLEAYDYKCAITNFDVEYALEAAHIIPYIETGDNHPSNGILLRADLHTLFDLNLITVHPETLKILLSPNLIDSSYSEFHDKILRLPKAGFPLPNNKLLQQRFNRCMEIWNN